MMLMNNFGRETLVKFRLTSLIFTNEISASEYNKYPFEL